jgi:hypothetical protein
MALFCFRVIDLYRVEVINIGVRRVGGEVSA